MQLDSQPMLFVVSVTACGICLICWVVMAVRYSQHFDQYCDRVAVVEGRLAERRSKWRFEDGSNVFEIEQAWRLLRRPYLASGDQSLRAVGDAAWISGIWTLLWGLATLLLGLTAALLTKT
jgi:hypothetical protein